MPATPSNSVQPYSSGASYIYLGLGGGKAKSPLFFGTCEGFPKHERRPDYMQLMNDVGGRRKPIDMAFQGEDATLSVVMTVWNEGMAQMLEQMPDVGLANSNLVTPGRWKFNDVGALMAFEGMAIPIWIAYGFSGIGGSVKNAYSSLVPGYHYYQAIPFSPMTTDEGSEPMKRHFQFYIWAKADFTTQTHFLYDNLMTGLPLPTNGPVAA